MTNVSELVHTDRPVGFWRLNDPLGSTTIRDYGETSNLHGAPFEGVRLGQPGIAAGSRGSAGFFSYPAVAASMPYIEIPSSSLLAVSNLTVGAWLRAKRSFNQYDALVYYRLDEAQGTTIALNHGSLGSGQNGTYTGPVQLQQVGALPGVTGTAGLFARLSGTYISVPDHTNLRLNSGAFVIGFFNTLKTEAAGDVVVRKGDPATADGYALFRDANGIFRFVRNNVTVSYGLSGIDVVKPHHIALKYNGSSVKWYVNGILKETDSVAAYPTNTGTDALTIGGASASNGYDGWLDDVAIYNVELPDAELLNMAQGYPPNTTPTFGWDLMGRPNRWDFGWSSFPRGWNFRPWRLGAPANTEVLNSYVVRGQRYFVAGGFDGGTNTSYLWVNGVVADTTVLAGGMDVAATIMRIGQVYNNITFAGDWDVEGVFVFDRFLGTARIAEYYAAGDWQSTPICPVQTTRSHERIIYKRPEVAGEVSYLLHSPPSRVVLSEEGFGTPPLEYIADRAPFQHGDTVRSFALRPRTVQLAVLHNFRNRSDYWDGRQQLLGMLRPNALQALSSTPALSPERQGKLLVYQGNNQKRQLDVLLESGPGFAPPQGGWREWSFTEVLRFVAHNPVWYDPKINQQTLASSGQVNLVFPVTFPFEFSTSNFTGVVSYKGDWPEKPKIFIYGPITSPAVIHSFTGKRLQLLTAILAEYYVEINLQLSTVTRSDGLNLLGFLSDDSDLTGFTLEPDPIVANGANTLVVEGSGTSGSTPAPVITWYNRYIGI